MRSSTRKARRFHGARHGWTLGLALGGALALGAGCAHGGAEAVAQNGPAAMGPSASAGDQRLVLVRAGHSAELQLAPGGVSGPYVQLSQSGSNLRGRAFDRIVDLHWSDGAGGGQVTGSINSVPVNLRVTSSDAGWAARGMFGGSLGELSVGPAGVNGRVGRCSYDLRAAGPARFEGQSACPAVPAQTSLTVPAAVTALSAAEQAAVVAVLLAG